jgi:GT2 family glycosyltransferase
MIENIVSIVLHKYNSNEIIILVNRILNINPNCLIYLIDNSNKNSKEFFLFDKRIKYIKNIKNVGYGKAHNISIKHAINNNLKYCFILNYDIELSDNVFIDLMNFINSNKDVAMAMPMIVNQDFSPQWLPKLQPTPIDILKRKLFHISNRLFFKNFMNKYEFRDINFNNSYNIPNLSGCFLLLNIDLLRNEAFFDERFFLYFEDYDLSRRVTMKYKTIIYNKSFVVHDYQSSANRNLYLFFIYFTSFIKYFNKWGWFNNKKLKFINKNIFIINT